MNKFFDLCTVIVLLFTTLVNTEEDIIEDIVNLSSSLDSISKETYNISSKEKPYKRVFKMRSDFSDNSLSDLEDNMNDKNTLHENNTTAMEVPAPLKTRRRKQINHTKSYPKFSFTASIQKRSSHYATGALVNKKWILSVAELFYNVRESIKLYKARLGSFHCKEGGLVLHLKGIEIHPQYKYKEPNFDISLLRIGRTPTDVTNSLVPISLPTLDESDLNNIFWSTYWARLIVEGNVLSPLANERYQQNIMRISHQAPIPWRECKKILKKMNVTLDNSSMCLEPIKTHHSRCLPDPGAPIVAENYLWGITSGWTSSECLKKTSPTLVTGVSSPLVLPWIYSVFDESKVEIDEKPFK